jgi:hypothetical protein
VSRDRVAEVLDRPPVVPGPDPGAFVDLSPADLQPLPGPIGRYLHVYHALSARFRGLLSFASSPALSARFRGLLSFAFSPRGAPIVLSVAGAFFWMWAFGLFFWFSTLRPHHSPPRAEAPLAASADPAAVAPAPAPPEPTTGAIAPARTEAPSTGAPANAPAARGDDTEFHNAAAIRALDGKWREVAKCRRGKAWGKASTTVTFASDGSVTHVDVGPPFAGTPTGDCIADTLATTRAPPFGGDAAVLVYRVYVAPK